MKNDRISESFGVAGTGGGGGGDIIMPGFNDVNIGVHGVEASGICGVLTVVFGVDVLLSGVDAATFINDVSIQIDDIQLVKGTLATGFIGTVAIPNDIIISPSGIECTGLLGTVTIPANFVYLDSIFPSTTVAGNTIEIRFMGIGFDQPNLQINVSGKGIAITTISNVTYYSFNAIFQVNPGGNGVGTHTVTVQTDVGISGSKDFVVSPRK